MIERPSNFDTIRASKDNGIPRMKVTLALLADAANVSQEGKLNVLGIFNSFNAGTFPALHPVMQLVLRFEASVAEAAMEKKLLVKVLGEDGEQIGEIAGNLKLPEKPQQQGRRIQMQAIIPVQGAVFPKPGQYAFSILIDGREEDEVTLSITQTQTEGGDR